MNKEAELLLCDGREQVCQALAAAAEELGFRLRSAYVRAPAEGDTVTWGEWANKSTDCPVVDELSYQVKVWARDLDRLRTLCDGVNRAMLALGLRRTYTSPDEFSQDGAGCYTKTFRFGRKVDKRTMRLID